MNYAFVGLPFKDNIGNGKSLSAVELIIQKYLFNDKIIYTNIKMNGLDKKEQTLILPLKINLPSPPSITDNKINYAVIKK